MKLLAGRDHGLDDVLAMIQFDPSAVDLAGVREVLAEIEAGLGEGGLLAALDRVEQRLSSAAVPRAAPPAPRKAPRRPR